jgi:phospholipase A1
MRRMLRLFLCFALLAASFASRAQPSDDWKSCTGLDDKARLACFDRWATGQGAPAAPAAVAPPPPAIAPPASAVASPAVPAVPPPPPPVLEAPPAVVARDCRNPTSRLAGVWELDTSSSCGTLGLRSYRPMGVSLVMSDSVNKQPTSDNPANVAATATPFRNTETRINLSVRTKIARGLLVNQGELRDSIWFAYSQQSSWQLFTPAVSRPFRNTDHEPEVIYVTPVTGVGLGGWKLRYGGLGLVHQSNGQSLPLSRSWNRVYLMAGAENERGFSLFGRLWHRIPEDAAKDDNPRISDYVGRAELAGSWTSRGGTRVQLTYRNNLRDMSHGSIRADWLLPLDTFVDSNFGSMRLHAQLFTGYGDSLIDFNRRRTVLSLGVSLVDW